MKFTVNKNNIVDVLSNIQGITGRKSGLAITETVLIRATGSGITLIATDLETGFEGWYPAVIESEGTVALNARKFYEIVREFPTDEILVNEVKNHWIEIGNQNVQYHIVGMDPDNFPDTIHIEEAVFFETDSIALKKMIDKTVIIVCPPDDKRAHVNGICFERIINEDKKLIRMISTDGGRLSTVDYIYNNDFNLPSGPNVIIPKKALNEVSKFLQFKGVVKIGFKDSYFIIKKDNETIIIRLLEGDFPKYDDIIIKKGGYIINLDKYLFLMVLKRMSILSSEDYKGVIFNFKDNKLIITTTNPDIGESKEDIDIDFNGEPIEVAFNPRYFIETLNVIDDDQIIINIIDKEKPCLIKGKDDKKFLTVIMPMRI